jgi:hypothetical protein
MFSCNYIILELLRAKGPQSRNQIVAELERQAEGINSTNSVSYAEAALSYLERNGDVRWSTSGGRVMYEIA